MFSVTNELTTVSEMGSRIFDFVFWILGGLSQSAYKLRITFSWTKILINKKLASIRGLNTSAGLVLFAERESRRIIFVITVHDNPASPVSWNPGMRE